VAQKNLVILTCDVEGEEVPATATHHFSVDGKNYVIDLGEVQDKEFLKAILPWTEYARFDKGPKPSSPSAKAKTSKASTGETSKIRSWAADNGFEVGQRGRVPDQVVTAYWQAHP
jgi:hypothetical protein